MKMRKLKVGLIGIGKWGAILNKKLKKNSNLVFSVNSKTPYLDKLNSVDWIFIATPDETHFSIVKKILKRKKNIFCEKPLTLNYKKSKYLFDLAKKNKTRLYVDNIQTFYKKKIFLKKNNFITRQKKGKGSPKYLLYRFAYHDFYYLYDFLKNKKIKQILIEDKKRDLRFKIIYKDKTIFNFHYSLNSEKKIHMINKFNFVTKKDLLNIMIKSVIKSKVNFNKNQKQSLFANLLIDKIRKKL